MNNGKSTHINEEISKFNYCNSSSNKTMEFDPLTTAYKI